MRRDLNPRWTDASSPRRPGESEVSGRPVAWRADLAVRLAKRIRRPGDRIVPLALDLLKDGEVTARP